MMFSVGSRRAAWPAGLHHDAPARQALADIVVGIAGQLERHAARQEGAEALAGRAGEAARDRVFRQAGMAVAPGHFARQHGADGAVDIADACAPAAPAGHARCDGMAAAIRSWSSADVEPVILLLAIVDGDARLGRAPDSRMRDRSTPLAFQWATALLHVELVDPADHLVQRCGSPAAP